MKQLPNCEDMTLITMISERTPCGRAPLHFARQGPRLVHLQQQFIFELNSLYVGGVQNTYLRYEAAGDMHVGRTVSGLPPDSHEFAILPRILTFVIVSSRKQLRVYFQRYLNI
ncbi:hypothetical protein F441_15982 [Phytophthora nicotianae CJ01A1]|uniref:Uncharacterized protein n=3 Tax=Phytophthora nicotianae TaxID=4792 RepID=W2YM74_PHYNI|nr:hypothetical protein L915_15710 [Phytophthora nicotianae]ETL31646.1 hypothetical protein L916_15603 [Phytophthora nicotianae]ETL84881.1 hypothetical protein L917_15422 [Phytophthora nicotianae]ETP07894.1 hypothetical protein F441_15982 [Phytophthora nicotianae CJ01A1]ETP35932.1 hypothetical protein F442_16008 [Phytophthora nicotianae P10297]